MDDKCAVRRKVGFMIVCFCLNYQKRSADIGQEQPVDIFPKLQYRMIGRLKKGDPYYVYLLCCMFGFFRCWFHEES